MGVGAGVGAGKGWFSGYWKFIAMRGREGGCEPTRNVVEARNRLVVTVVLERRSTDAGKK